MLGAETANQFRWTRVFVKRGGVWQCVLYQTTRIVPSTGRASTADLKSQLVGTYRLVSYQRTVVATGQTTDPYGKSPQGYIMYGGDGRMMVLYAAGERPNPNSLATMTDQERANLYKTMVAYGGTYDFDGKTVKHHIDVCQNPLWAKEQVKDVRFDGQTLVFTYSESSALDGEVSMIVTWERVD